MYCLKCKYDLRRLPEPRCPECGTVFDPADSATYARAATSSGKLLPGLLVTFAFSPLMLPLMIVLVWLTACLCLGRIPKAGADDPKYAHPLLGAVYTVSIVAFIGAFWMMWLFWPLAIAYLIKRRDGRSRKIVGMLGLFWFCSIGCAWSCKGSYMAYWYFD